MASSSLSSRRGAGATWTPQQNKEFEKALAKFDKDTPERWQNIAKAVGGGKTVEDVKTHFDILLEDLRRIESGRVPVPNYRNHTASAGEEEKRLMKYLKFH